MVESFNFGYFYIHLWEWIALPLYLLVILMWAYYYQKKKRKTNPVYKYYIPGLIAKIGISMFFALLYLYYYEGGDTFAYYESALCMRNLMFSAPLDWMKNEFGGGSTAHLAFFTHDTGFPLMYMYKDPRTFMVIRLMSILILPAFDSYLIATIITAWVCYSGIWRLYLVFTTMYPKLHKSLAIAILFFPSVLFWGSGILKDSITLSCTGWVVYCIYHVFILKKRKGRYIPALLIFAYVILAIKPYIIFALLPGCLMWIFSDRIYKIKNVIAKLLIIPFIILICGIVGYFVLTSLSSYLGKFSLEQVVRTALVTQDDLKQAYYLGHSFDIGLKAKTPLGLLLASPKGLLAGIYRPFIWESDNLVMLLSGLENAFILGLSVLLLLRRNIISILRRLFGEPLLFFAFTYSIFFAASVGLTTSNFGALVRFKIAYLPFFIASILILYNKKPVKTENA